MHHQRSRLFRLEAKTLFLLSGPIIVAQLLHVGMHFVDTLMLGQYGTQELAAMALASTYFSVFVYPSFGVLTATSPVIANAFARGQSEEIHRDAHNLFGIAALLSVVIMIVFFFCGPLLIYLGQDPSLIPLSNEYLKVIAFGMPAFLFYGALRQLTEGVGDTKPSMIVGAIGVSANIVLDYMFIFGRFGAPKLGLMGAALTTVVVFWLMFFAMLVYVAVKKNYRQFYLFRSCAVVSVRMKELFTLGAPIYGAWLMETGYFSATLLLSGTLGTVALASHQVAITLAAFVFMIPFGLGMGQSVRVGFLLGKKDYSALKVAVAAGTSLTVFISLFVIFFFLALPETTASLFSNDKELIAVTAQLLVITGAFHLFDCLQSSASGNLRGLQETRAPFYSSILSFWCFGITASILFGKTLNLGVEGIWYGIVIGVAVAAVILNSFLFYKVRRLAEG